MANAQEIFNRIQAAKKEQREIKLSIKQALADSNSYSEIADEVKKLKARQKGIAEAIKEDFQSEISKLDTLKNDIENDEMLLSDLSLSSLAKGKQLTLWDDYKNKYEPEFKVKFKKQ